MQIEKLHKRLIERRDVMSLNILDQPPADWAQFQLRLGRFNELQELLKEVEVIMSGKEKDRNWPVKAVALTA